MIAHIRDVDIESKMVFVRADFDVPIDRDGNITDDRRVTALFATLRYCIEHHARVVVAGHRGRPHGMYNQKLTMTSVTARLQKEFGECVHAAKDCVGDDVMTQKRQLPLGHVLVLENVRFHKGETKNDPAFADALAEDIDVYVAEAFATLHREHASIVGVPERVVVCAMGFYVAREIEKLQPVLRDPQHPFVIVIGGKKISDKIDAMKHLIERCDVMLIGGGVANTFLRAQGMNVGASSVTSDTVSQDQENVDYVAVAKELLARFSVTGSDSSQLIIPHDMIASTSVDREGRVVQCDTNDMKEDEKFFDIGPETAQQFSEIIKTARTIVWNGPMGVFEQHMFAHGTRVVAESIIASKGYSVVAGGDTGVMLDTLHCADKFSHISTGGSACMILLSGKKLAGLEILNRK